MKNKIIYITVIILIVLLAWSYLSRPVSHDMSEYIKIGGKKYELLSKKRDTVYKDTIIYKDVYVPKPYPVPGDPIPVPVDIDTTEILKDYYQKYVYNDTITDLDGEGSTAVINDTVSQNRIISREARFDIKNKIITETITVKEPEKLKVWLGGGMGFNTGISPENLYGSILIKNKKDRVLGLDTGIMLHDGVTPYVGATLYFKLRFRK